jgi:hypothetical protein
VCYAAYTRVDGPARRCRRQREEGAVSSRGVQRHL